MKSELNLKTTVCGKKYIHTKTATKFNKLSRNNNLDLFIENSPIIIFAYILFKKQTFVNIKITFITDKTKKVPKNRYFLHLFN